MPINKCSKVYTVKSTDPKENPRMWQLKKYPKRKIQTKTKTKHKQANLKLLIYEFKWVNINICKAVLYLAEACNKQ